MNKQTLAQTRAQLKADDEKAKQRFTGDGASFPHWLTPEGKTTSIRFLPDANENNPYFWVARETIRLPFADNVTITVPCLRMFGAKTDPILEYVKKQGWWKMGEAERTLALQYYIKRSYIAQGFVVSTDIVEESSPENPIRRFALSPQIYDIVKAGLMNPDIEDMPTDGELGRDFKVTKGRRGEYADYQLSSFSFKSRPLSTTERDAIDKYGMTDLSVALGRNPDADEQAVIYEMFLSSLRGDEFDAGNETWAKYYKPYSKPAADKPTAAAEPKTAKESAVKKHAAQADAMLAEIRKKTPGGGARRADTSVEVAAE